LCSLKNFDFDPDPEMSLDLEPESDSDPELSEKSDLAPDPEIIFSAPTNGWWPWVRIPAPLPWPCRKNLFTEMEESHVQENTQPENIYIRRNLVGPVQ